MPIFMFFGAKAPNMEIRPQTSKFLENFETYNCFRIISLMHFQRALNDFLIYLQTRIMPIFVFLGPKPQIWKSRTRPLKFVKKQIFWFRYIYLTNMLLKSLQPLPNNYLFSRYCIYSKKWNLKTGLLFWPSKCKKSGRRYIVGHAWPPYFQKERTQNVIKNIVNQVITSFNISASTYDMAK